jgi:hypothetical protein
VYGPLADYKNATNLALSVKRQPCLGLAAIRSDADEYLPSEVELNQHRQLLQSHSITETTRLA